MRSPLVSGRAARRFSGLVPWLAINVGLYLILLYAVWSVLFFIVGSNGRISDDIWIVLASLPAMFGVPTAIALVFLYFLSREAQGKGFRTLAVLVLLPAAALVIFDMSGWVTLIQIGIQVAFGLMVRRPDTRGRSRPDSFKDRPTGPNAGSNSPRVAREGDDR
jgi:hypothetical protein